jgi:hypothetical protein
MIKELEKLNAELVEANTKMALADTQVEIAWVTSIKALAKAVRAKAKAEKDKAHMADSEIAAQANEEAAVVLADLEEDVFHQEAALKELKTRIRKLRTAIVISVMLYKEKS